jgi:fucose permease
VSVPSGSWRLPVVLSYVAFVFIGVAAGVGGVLLPAQIDDYGVSKSVMGITFFAFSAGFMLAGSTAGPLVHRLGIRLALVVGGGTFVAGALVMGIRPSFLVLLLAQVAAGYGTGMMETLLNLYLTTLPNAATLISRLHGFFGVGALIGPVLAAWMLRSVTWPVVWLLLAAICLALSVGFLALYPRGDAAAEDEPHPRGLLGTALRTPAVLLASVFLAVYVGLELGVGNWGYTYMVDVHNAADLGAGYTISGYWLGLTLGRFVINPLAARLGRSIAESTFACLIGVTIMSALIWVSPTEPVAAIGFVLLGFFLGPLFPTAIAVVPDVVEPRLVATAIGILNGVSLVGGAALPWAAGTIAQGVGLWTLMPYALALAVVQLAIWWALAARMRQPQLESSTQLG